MALLAGRVHIDAFPMLRLKLDLLKEKKTDVSYYHRSRLVRTYKSPISDEYTWMCNIAASHGDELQMDTHDGESTRCERRVQRQRLLVLRAEIGAIGRYTMYVTTHKASGMG